MGGRNFRDAYEFDPESHDGEGGGGLLSRLQPLMRQGGAQSTAEAARSNSSNAREYSSESYGSPQGGLLGRLIALQAEQNQYRPIPQYGGQARPAALPLPPGAVASSDWPQLPQAGTRFEVDQAQQARDAAAARLVRGVRSLARAEGPPPDPIDIARSARTGVVYGTINAAGLPADVLTGFGHFPNDHLKPWTSDELRCRIEGRWGQFYQPQSRVGRFAETIGEMAPMVVGGEALTIRGLQKALEAMRRLPGVLAKHAVAPGVAVQTLEEAYPESPAGEAVQKGYPVLRRVLPAVLATQRYLSK